MERWASPAAESTCPGRSMAMPVPRNWFSTGEREEGRASSLHRVKGLEVNCWSGRWRSNSRARRHWPTMRLVFNAQ